MSARHTCHTVGIRKWHFTYLFFWVTVLVILRIRVHATVIVYNIRRWQTIAIDECESNEKKCTETKWKTKTRRPTILVGYITRWSKDEEKEYIDVIRGVACEMENKTIIRASEPNTMLYYTYGIMSSYPLQTFDTSKLCRIVVPTIRMLVIPRKVYNSW